MSSISISTPAVVPVRSISTVRTISPAGTATRLRLTVRGRRVLVMLAAIPIAAGVAFAALGGGSAIASGEAVPTVEFETVTVMPGDTLWSIAESIAPGEDPRSVVSEIQRLNALSSGSLQVGQQLALPND